LALVALERARLFADTTTTGSAWCEFHREAVDSWLTSLFEEVAAADGIRPPAALVAVGGYGRGDLCPRSDIDVMLVHEKGFDAAALADRLWYPIWDTGIHMGHSVSTPAQALSLAASDLETATSLLSLRPIAGDAALAERLRAAAVEQWRSNAKQWLTQLAISVRERHATRGDVAFAQEPDLKEDRGGLRDVQALRWADLARSVLVQDDGVVLAAAYETLLATRVELQRHTERSANTLVLEDRAAVAARLGLEPDDIMARIAEAGRAVGWRSDDAWRRVALMVRGPLGRLARRSRSLAEGVELRDGEVHVLSPAAVARPAAVLHIAEAAARHGAALSRGALEMLAGQEPVDWTDEARAALVRLLRCGRNAVGIIESLTQARIWSSAVLPEWAEVHARPQHNPYHRYTVDRHLLEAVANAAKLTETVERPDLLVMGALLHDIGKGREGDHTEAGVVMARQIATRMGFAPEDVDTIVALVEHHLLLVDAATRRDLDDPATVSRVADAVGSSERLRLLAALAEADGRATGQAAWTPWRAELVGLLVEHVEHLLEQGVPRRVAGVDLTELIDAAVDGVSADGDTITVTTADRPGVFSRVAGVLALHGLEVISATALSTESGLALSQFKVHDPLRADPPWNRVRRDVELALAGRLALDARIAERAARYRRHGGPPRSGPVVRFDDDASMDATVIDVHATDGVGVLYRITRAMMDLDLDIRSAKVQTIGHEVVDAFYVLDRHGARITDDGFRAEVARAISHALGGPGEV
jgi:[protein-PII] uridylyltransferase